MQIDKKTLKRFIDGDLSAFRTLFRAAINDVYWLAYNIVKNKETAEDIVQEVFLKIYQMRQQIDTTRSLYALIVKMTTNLAIDETRKARRENWEFQPDEIKNRPDPEAAGEITLTRKIALQQGLDNLPVSYRSALLLKYTYDLSYEQIAETLGISVPAVALRIKRGKEMLRFALSDPVDEKKEKDNHEL